MYFKIVYKFVAWMLKIQKLHNFGMVKFFYNNNNSGLCQKHNTFIKLNFNPNKTI